VSRHWLYGAVLRSLRGSRGARCFWMRWIGSFTNLAWLPWSSRIIRRATTAVRQSASSGCRFSIFFSSGLISPTPAWRMRHMSRLRCGVLPASTWAARQRLMRQRSATFSPSDGGLLWAFEEGIHTPANQHLQQRRLGARVVAWGSRRCFVAQALAARHLPRFNDSLTSGRLSE
jgi:hypothetical protein